MLTQELLSSLTELKYYKNIDSLTLTFEERFSHIVTSRYASLTGS